MIKKIGPFDGLEVFDKGEWIENPFSGAKVFLEPDAVAMYDLIKGLEIVEDFKKLRKGLDYFRKTWPDEYMVLLD